MGQAMKISVYVISTAIIAGLAAFAFYGNEQVEEEVATSNEGATDSAGENVNIDMSMLQSGTNSERDRRIERVMLEARYQAELAEMAGASEKEIERLKKRYRNDREDMRARHKAEAEAEAQEQAEAAGEGSAEQD